MLRQTGKKQLNSTSLVRTEYAADGGDVSAVCSLGNTYEHGTGDLEVDLWKAAQLYKKAHEGGNALLLQNGWVVSTSKAEVLRGI